MSVDRAHPPRPSFRSDRLRTRALPSRTAVSPHARPAVRLSTRLIFAVAVAGDGGAVLLAAAAAAAVAGSGTIDMGFARLALLAALFHIPIAFSIGAHDPDTAFGPVRSAARTLLSWATTLAFLTAMRIVLRAPAAVPDTVLLAWWGTGALFLALFRYGLADVAGRIRRRGLFDRHSAIIGIAPRAAALARYLNDHPWLTIRVTGCYDDAPGALHPDIVGGMADLIDQIRANHVDQVIIALPASERPRIDAIVATLLMTPVKIRHASELLAGAAGSPHMLLLDAVPLQVIADRPIDGLDRALKSMADRMVAFALIVALLPFLLLVAAAIRLDSPGPIFFRQPREGFNCGLFRIWKFRTMKVEAAPSADIVQACRRDPRVTRVGRLLRSTSIDELPQLLNVLFGDMSLVGPRPHARLTRVGHRLFCDVDAAYPARHRLKPGITGWAQVCGWRGETQTEDQLARRLEHDFHYIANWSIGFDLYILVRTVTTVLFQRGAY